MDVWSSDKRANYSRSFIPQLQEMGAQVRKLLYLKPVSVSALPDLIDVLSFFKVSKRFSKQVTHVVFNSGHATTWRNAKKSDVHLVSALWIQRYSDFI